MYQTFFHSDLEHLLLLDEPLTAKICLLDSKGADLFKKRLPNCDKNEPLPSDKVQININKEPPKDKNIGRGKLMVIQITV